MSNVVISIKVMPKSPETDIEEVETKVREEILGYAGKVAIKAEIEPFAFGLKILKIIFVMDEALGSPDEFVEGLTKIDGVNSAEVTDVRKAIG